MKKDAIATLGTIITEGDRDAIHIAVEPVIAGETLRPGWHIGLVNGKAYAVNGSYPGIKNLGIVDPFITSNVNTGDMFWLLVYPRTITSLRHVWEHPDFKEKEIHDKTYSENWLMNWCSETNDAPSYNDLIELFKYDVSGDWSLSGDAIVLSGSEASGFLPRQDELKHHLEVVIGEEIVFMPTYFSCSC